MADDLRLEAVGQDIVDVVVNQIARDGGDALLGFQDVAGGAVLLLDRKDFLVAAFLEQVFEFRVEAVLVFQRRFGCAAFVENLQAWCRRARRPSACKCRCIRRNASPCVASVLFRNQRRAGESDAGRVGKCLEKVIAQANPSAENPGSGAPRRS